MKSRERLFLLFFSIPGFVLSLQLKIAADEPVFLRGPETRVFNLAYSDDGKQLAAAYEDGSFRIWDVARGETTLLQSKAHEDHCRSIAWSADARTVWTTGDEGLIKNWNSQTGQPVGSALPIEKPYRVVVCRSPERLAVASRDAAIYLIPAGKPQGEVQRLIGHEGPIRDLSLSRDGWKLASVGHDHNLKIWDLQTGNCLQSSTGVGEGRLFAVAFSNVGNLVAFAGDGGRIQLFDGNENALKLDWKAHEREIRSLSFSRSGKMLASVGEDVQVRLWNVADGSLFKSLLGHEGKAYCVAFSPVEDTVAVGRSDGSIEVWRNLTAE